MEELPNKNLFSNAYQLEVAAADLECVDIDFTDDVELYVDPLLLYRSPIRLFNEAHTLIVQFFEHAIELVKSGKAENAKEMFSFPDAENHLGITERRSEGRG